MYPRVAPALLVLVLATPASAEELQAEQARHFVAGKLFAYSCFEGTRGSGRINNDGSVAGSVQFQGRGRIYHVRLPANTVRVEGGSVCASVRGVMFTPCFIVDKTSHYSFRGSVSGFSFAYCDFHRPGRRINVARNRAPQKLAPSELRTAINTP